MAQVWIEVNHLSAREHAPDLIKNNAEKYFVAQNQLRDGTRKVSV